ncbi:MAG: sigma-70 family RNA polymerase sigma factor [Deltaproteobacteria bacterium]|nr:MAG: sigma-70 family RNA polymerase sigma factor [Deltaproteobacteria bacterium]
MEMRPKLEVIEGGAQQPDRGAILRDFYERYAPYVYRRCRYLLRNDEDAEDAMQEVFAKALRHLDAFRGEASGLTWLTKIATHHCLNVLRARRAKWRDAFRRSEALRPVAKEGSELVEARDQVRRALARFDVETQRCAIHYHVDGMTLQEVADAVGRSIPTVRKRLAAFARAMEKLS